MKDNTGHAGRNGLATIEQRLAKAQASLAPRRKDLIHKILDQAEETYFLSSCELARRCEVDPATILRTVQALGYRHFAEFSADLRAYFIARITPYKLLKAESRVSRSVADHIDQALATAEENVSALRSTLPRDKVIELARKIDRAHQILIVGIDMAYSLSWNLAYTLRAVGFRAEAPLGSSGNLQHRIPLLSHNDLLIAISFGRCLRETVEAAERARKRKVATFGITDSSRSAIARSCDDFLTVSTNSSSFAGSYAAAHALLDAALVACGQIRPARSLRYLQLKDSEYASGRRWYAPLPGHAEE